MNEVMNTILHRRSVRKYQPKQITDEELDRILTAGEYAPCAGGRQSPVFVVCQDAVLNREFGEINLGVLRAISDKRPGMKPGENNAPKKLGLEPGKVSAFHNAPTVITVFAPKDWYNFTLDCAVAAENMMLAADALGIGSCLIARAEETFATERGKEVQSAWGLDETYEAKLHVLLGYSAEEPRTAKPRRDGRRILVK